MFKGWTERLSGRLSWGKAGSEVNRSMAGPPACLHLLEPSIATAEHSALHVSSHSSFPSPQLGPRLHSTMSGFGTRSRAHTYAQISGSIKDSQKSTGYPNWAHFHFLQWGCPKDLKSIYTHFLIGRGLLHCQSSLRFRERGTGR